MILSISQGSNNGNLWGSFGGAGRLSDEFNPRANERPDAGGPSDGVPGFGRAWSSPRSGTCTPPGSACEPSDPEPPDKLIELAETIRDPLVRQSGVTTTADGRWALYVTVPGDAAVPIPSVESQADGFPVVYEAEPDEPPRAGPAYPTAGRSPTRGKGRGSNN